MNAITIIYTLVALTTVYLIIRSSIKVYKILREKQAYVRLTIFLILQLFLIALLLLTAYDMVADTLGYPQLRILRPLWETYFQSH